MYADSFDFSIRNDLCLFGPSYATAKGVEVSALFGLLLGLITTNSVLEAIIATLIVTPLTKVLEPITKKVI